MTLVTGRELGCHAKELEHSSVQSFLPCALKCCQSSLATSRFVCLSWVSYWYCQFLWKSHGRTFLDFGVPEMVLKIRGKKHSWFHKDHTLHIYFKVAKRVDIKSSHHKKKICKWGVACELDLLRWSFNNKYKYQIILLCTWN